MCLSVFFYCFSCVFACVASVLKITEVYDYTSDYVSDCEKTVACYAQRMLV